MLEGVPGFTVSADFGRPVGVEDQVSRRPASGVWTSRTVLVYTDTLPFSPRWSPDHTHIAW